MRALMLFAIGAIACAAAPAARAASYSVSKTWLFSSDGSDSSPQEIDPFGTTLGTLESISYELSGIVFPEIYANALFSPCCTGIPDEITGFVSASVNIIFGAAVSIAEDVTLPLVLPDLYGLGVGLTGGVPFGTSGMISLSDYDSTIAIGGSLYLQGGGRFTPDLPVICDYCLEPTLTFAAATVTYTYAAPEPEAISLLGVGLLGLGMVRRRSCGGLVRARALARGSQGTPCETTEAVHLQ
jgi:hypothetical protein